MDTLDLTIHDLSRGGAGVGKDSNGRIVFVPYTAPGDLVRVEILSTKKNYAQAKLLEVLKPSSERIQPKCPVFTQCGGCDWQHLPYELQWSTKVKGALQALKRSGLDITKMEGLIPLEEFQAANPWNYRNRIQLRGEGDKVGFYKRGSKDTLVAFDRCEITRNEINDALPEIRKEGAQLGTPYKVEIDVTPQGKVRTAWNAKHAALGFRQINDEQNEVLKKWVISHLKKDRVLLDLYGGNGNFSLGLVSQMKHIHCVDVGAHTSKPQPGIEFHKSGVAKWLQTYRSQQQASAILDPPREGLGDDFTSIEAALSKNGVDEILLIGCDEDAWAKDCIRLHNQGWKLVKLAFFDLFPQTKHVESVAKWTRNR